MGSNSRWHSLLIGAIVAKAFGIASLVAFFYLNGVTPSAQAAQTVLVRRGSFTKSIDLADLQTLANTRTVPPNLQSYAQSLSPQQRNQILSALQANFNVNAIAVRDLLDTEIGNTFISALAAVTNQTDSVGKLKLATALIQASSSLKGQNASPVYRFSIISFIEAFPSSRLEIDLDQAFQVFKNFDDAFWQSQAFMGAIYPRLTSTHPQIDLPFNPTQPGSAKVQVRTLNLNDEKRGRKILVDVYWSAEASPAKPVIVFCQGLDSGRTELRYLAEHLASHGYVVAALEHPGSNETETHKRNALMHNSPHLQAEEFLHRPMDISFVLDQLKTYNETPGQLPGQLQGKLAPDRALVVGYSLGGTTALSVAGAELQLTELKKRCSENISTFSWAEQIQCFARGLPENQYRLQDPRVKAVIALSPITSLLFGKTDLTSDTGLTKVAVPTLIAAGSADKTAPALIEQVIGFEKIPSPKWLVGFVGGTHLSMKDPSTTLEQASQSDTPFTPDEVVGEKVRNYVKAIALAMAAQLTEDKAQYTIFLTPEYALLASTKSLPIRIVTEIPPKADAILKDFIQKHPPRS
jgi:predicted dienelactone hydrolase